MLLPRVEGLTKLDRLICWASPRHGLQRIMGRKLLTSFGYHGVNATKSRGTSGGLFNNASLATAAFERDRINLIWETRDAEINIPFTQGLLARTAHFCVPRLTWQQNSGDKGVNKIYEDYVAEKARKVDLAGKFSLQKLVELGYRSRWRDGDCGFVDTEESGEFKLQSVEADRIGNVMSIYSGDEKLVGGFHLNDLEQMTSVDIYNRSHMNHYTFSENVDASRFHHVWDAFRLDQVRGHSPLAAVNSDIRDLYEVFNYDMIGIKHAASFAGFWKNVTNPYGGQGAAAWDGKDPLTGLNYINAKPGTVVKSPDGAEYVAAPANHRPSGEFMNFVELKVRIVMNALDLPVSYGWDLAKFGGVTARLETKYADSRFEYDRLQLDVGLATPWVHNQLRRGIAEGDIPPTKHWKRGKWNWGPRLSADVLNDANARAIALRSNLTTKTREIEEAGGKFAENIETKAHEYNIAKEIAERTDVPMELLLEDSIQPSTMIAAMKERDNAVDPNDPNAVDPNAPPAPGGLVATHGDKSAKLVLDVVKQFNQGLMTREEAMGTLITLYDISPEDAAVIIPERGGVE